MTLTIILVLHVLMALGLVAMILIQHGKGADAGAAFGSGASSTVFGAQGSASFLTRLTAGLATGFFVTSMVLAYMGRNPAQEVDIMQNVGAPEAAVEEVIPPAVKVDELGDDAAPPPATGMGLVPLETDSEAPPPPAFDGLGSEPVGTDTGAPPPAAGN